MILNPYIVWSNTPSDTFGDLLRYYEIPPYSLPYTLSEAHVTLSDNLKIQRAYKLKNTKLKNEGVEELASLYTLSAAPHVT